MTKSVELPHNKLMLKNLPNENIANCSTGCVEDKDHKDCERETNKSALCR